MSLPAWAVGYLRRGWWTLPVTGAVVLVVAVVLLAVGDYRATRIPAPGKADIAPPTVILDAKGEPVRHLEEAVVGEEVDADTLPDHVVRAVLAAEDRRFWGHSGFSVPDIARAVVANVRNRAVAQGASTLTQQYVDLTTPGEQRSYREKFREIVAAWKYERHLGKDEILDRYLNVVPFGRDTTGIDAAAQVYFGVAAADLDVNRAATLAGMIAAPSSFDPAENPEGAKGRRNVVLRGMREQGWLPASEVRRLVDQPIPEIRTGPLVQPGEDAYFVDAVRRRLQEVLPDTDLSRGLRISTTMDPRIQEVAQQAVARHVGPAPYTGAAVTIDPGSGAVRALVGGSDFAEESYNAAVQALRQPGSAFKPFTLAAFVDEGWSPDESEFPAPRTIEVDTPDGPHEVENFGGASWDELSVREATERSVNTVYMQMIEELGPGRVAEMARTLGLQGEIPEVPSLTLGTASVSPLSVASAYATLAAEGVHHEPHLVTRVVDDAGDVLYEHSAEGERVVSEQVAGVVTDVLAGVVEHGTGRAADIDREVAGKTGTTNDSRDAWFVGFTPQLATSVWIGMADNTPMGEDATGGGLAAPVWADLMREAMAPMEEMPLPTADLSGLEEFDRTPDEPTWSPEPGPAPAPQPSPTTSSPTPTPTPTPTQTPTPTPTGTTTTSSPTPTESDTSSPTPTTSETSEPEPSETDTATESQSTSSETPTSESASTEEPSAEETSDGSG